MQQEPVFYFRILHSILLTSFLKQILKKDRNLRGATMGYV